ncbi:WSC-domain-containing protein [Sistotremastrum suecicum HHB10207 ss-3]|uniref:WSC-domain-containing protein n=1 Tax=Sistotremastrum suecicum HHB10207 ss-3 TaxID=1314776 RepID=A0A165XD10_9AGAM|nr:WSC-domain-containing protein [Sistotremastrum suecicum HHB10207 ss-3]
MFSSLSFALIALMVASTTHAYWLMGINNFIASERMDPIVSPNQVSSHAHTIFGGSNFGFNVTSAQLRASKCTSVPIPQDHSNYWFPHLYFQWKNGSFSSLSGGAVVYYLFSDTPGTTTAFPENFRMITGDPSLRTYNASSYAQQAVTFLCLNFDGTSTRFNQLPAQECPSGVRAQINFPMCWDGKNVDSSDHKSHVSFPSGGPDSGTCGGAFPITLPRVFMEVYWASNDFDSVRSQAMNPSQPFVYANGDPTGYSYHADFYNGWDIPTLQKAVDNCHCNPYGDPTCCVDAGIFDFDQKTQCHITPQVDEVVLGTLPKLPGNNPVTYTAGTPPPSTAAPPAILSPPTAYTGSSPPPGACTLSGGAAIVPSASGYGYTGCYVDGSPRTLSNTIQPATKNVESCLALCKSAGYKYCGLEYGGECYGANSLSGSGRGETDDGRCSMACTGAPNELCGGPDGLSFYTLGGSVNITQSCTRSATVGGAAVAPPPPVSSPVIVSTSTKTTSTTSSTSTSSKTTSSVKTTTSSSKVNLGTGNTSSSSSSHPTASSSVKVTTSTSSSTSHTTTSTPPPSGSSGQEEIEVYTTTVVQQVYMCPVPTSSSVTTTTSSKAATPTPMKAYRRHASAASKFYGRQF